VVCQDGELPPLQHKPEVEDTGNASPQFLIKSGILDLGWLQLFGKES
jgi:hypothetical protein